MLLFLFPKGGDTYVEVKYSNCCGLDVHKKVIVSTIVKTNKEGISEYQQKSFSTINSDIQRFHDWLVENDCYHVCMESTGKSALKPILTSVSPILNM